MKAFSRKISWLAALVVLVMALPGGAAPEDRAEEQRLARIVARVDDVTITVGDLEERLRRHMRPEMFEDTDRLKDLVDSLVDRELLVQEARNRKLDENKRVVNHLKRILYNQIQTKYVAEKLPLESITMEEIRAYYDEHGDEYNQPTLVRAYHILVKDRAEAETLLAQVKQEGYDLRKFKMLAGERSEDPETKKRGGDLRYFSSDGKVWTSEEAVPGAVAEAAFSIEVLMGASVIVTSDEEQAKEAMDKAMMPGLTDAQFAKLVSRYRAEGAAGSGDLGMFNLEGLEEGAAPDAPAVPWDLTRAAFSVRDPGKTYPKIIKLDGKFYILRVTGRKDPGNLYPDLVQTDEGYHIVWVVNRRPAVSKSVEEMEPSIRQRIWQDKKKQFMEKLLVDLKKKYKVEIYEDRLEKVQIDLTDSRNASSLPPAPPAVTQPSPPPVPAS
jgi:EpsD family peptidyl-prolyl cis-trans isomerase